MIGLVLLLALLCCGTLKRRFGLVIDAVVLSAVLWIGADPWILLMIIAMATILFWALSDLKRQAEAE